MAFSSPSLSTNPIPVSTMAAVDQSELAEWRAASPADGASWLAGVSGPWWIAGGWALDLFGGTQSRRHGDLDIGVLRRDVAQVLGTLSSWEFFEAHKGRLTRLQTGTLPKAEVNSLWCRPAGTTLWAMELMLDAADDDRWVFRRQPEIQRPLATVIRWNPEGIPYLSPEIQLLYKARSRRAKDQADFDHIAPRMDSNARAWLRHTLLRTDPEHEWLPSLRAQTDD
ncbi:nucleotidyltransferase domain-containing protein [Steroidobacter cummioxidans]|uniref:nucleotidyltransferase domain-containing protein n=1 Tax=Steroidobacter cummioxidans TaxID=1803913 RepID=UPI0013795452|nr:amino acid transporter [Steroidobacter cummioxidans]